MEPASSFQGFRIDLVQAAGNELSFLRLVNGEGGDDGSDGGYSGMAEVDAEVDVVADLVAVIKLKLLLGTQAFYWFIFIILRTLVALVH